MEKPNKIPFLFVSVDPGLFFDAIIDAQEPGNEHKIAPLMCGAVKLLKQNRAKPENSLYLSLMFLSKSYSSVFTSETAIVEVSFSKSIKKYGIL